MVHNYIRTGIGGVISYVRRYSLALGVFLTVGVFGAIYQQSQALQLGDIKDNPPIKQNNNGLISLVISPYENGVKIVFLGRQRLDGKLELEEIVIQGKSIVSKAEKGSENFDHLVRTNKKLLEDTGFSFNPSH